MKVLKSVQRVPGGLMLIPMILAMFVNSFFPGVAQIGNPAQAIFSSNGTMTIVGIMLLFAGIHTDPHSLVLCFKKSGLLILLKLIISIVFGLTVMHFCGLDGLFGISTLALVACVSSTNSGLYMALMDQYGDGGGQGGVCTAQHRGPPLCPRVHLGVCRWIRH